MLGAVLAPLGISIAWQSVLFYPVAVFVLLALGLNVVVGQAGLLDLGYVAFYAVGRLHDGQADDGRRAGRRGRR